MTPRCCRHGFRALVVLVVLLSTLGGSLVPAGNSTSAGSFIVQAPNADVAADAVTRAGGAVTARLTIIGGVAATLTPAARDQLAANPGLRLHADQQVQTAREPAPTTSGPGEQGTGGYRLYPSIATGVYPLHQQEALTRVSRCENQRVTPSNQIEPRSLQGWGVTVAVVDSGFMKMQDAAAWSQRDQQTGALFAQNSEGRCFVYRDFLPRSNSNDNTSQVNSTDQSGHGTHVVSTIADNRRAPLAPDQSPAPVGVAPKVNLMIARVLDRNGAGSYSTVIQAIEWIVNNKDVYNVRVINLSLYTPVTGPYWADPLNQAVMSAWRAGLVVVVAGGNDGPDAGTITSPGNNPYVLTVGAIRSGRYTVSGDDELADYSSRGPTESAFVKPDVLVPASRTIAPVPDNSLLALAIPEARIQEQADVDYGIGRPLRKHTYYQLSGTSMAAAQVSGIVALILQANPSLTNDQVKYRILATARPAFNEETGVPIYTIWEQGAGRVDAPAAVFSDTTDAANQDLDLTLDLTTDTHFWGYSVWDEATGQFQLVDPVTGEVLDVWSGARRVWSGARQVWSGARRVWSGARRVWSGARRVWSGNSTAAWAESASLWAGARRVWSGTTPAISLSTTSGAEAVMNDEDVTRVRLPLIPVP